MCCCSEKKKSLITLASKNRSSVVCAVWQAVLKHQRASSFNKNTKLNVFSLFAKVNRMHKKNPNSFIYACNKSTKGSDDVIQTVNMELF